LSSTVFGGLAECRCRSPSGHNGRPGGAIALRAKCRLESSPPDKGRPRRGGPQRPSPAPLMSVESGIDQFNKGSLPNEMVSGTAAPMDTPEGTYSVCCRRGGRPRGLLPCLAPRCSRFVTKNPDHTCSTNLLAAEPEHIRTPTWPALARLPLLLSLFGYGAVAATRSSDSRQRADRLFRARLSRVAPAFTGPSTSESIFPPFPHLLVCFFPAPGGVPPGPAKNRRDFAKFSRMPERFFRARRPNFHVNPHGPRRTDPGKWWHGV